MPRESTHIHIFIYKCTHILSVYLGWGIWKGGGLYVLCMRGVREVKCNLSAVGWAKEAVDGDEKDLSSKCLRHCVVVQLF